MSPRKSSKSVTVNQEESEIEVLKRQVAELLNGKMTNQANEDIRLDKIVRVMSGFPGELNLPRLNGRPPLKFTEFGEIKNIQYGQLLEIIEQKEDFLLRGWFYILDKDVISKLGYSQLNLLSKEQIEKVIDFTCSTENAFELYKSGTDAQKSVIIDFLISKIRDGKDVNQNLVSLIEKDSKVKITEKAEQAKEYMELGVP